MSIKNSQFLTDLILHPKEAVAFYQKEIPAGKLDTILRAVTPYASVAKWKLVAVREKSNRLKILETMQDEFRKLGRGKWADTMERWKPAPVIFAFCVPETVDDFGGIPGETIYPIALIELGMGIQSLILTARAHGIETHWIAGALLIKDSIGQILKIPNYYELGFFGVAGYPKEEVTVEFPATDDLCFKEFFRDI